MQATEIRHATRQPRRAGPGLRHAALRMAMALVMVPLAVYAVDRPDARQPLDLTNLSVEELLAVDIDTVRGASGFSQRVTEAPSSVTVISADEIKKFGYRTLADVLNSVRGFYVAYDRNYHYTGVRGFGRPGDFNTRILLMVDGIRLNDNLYDMASVGTDFPVDIDLIDKIEIIRGASSSLYGSNAFMGVLNIYTKRGRDYKTAEVSGAAGSQKAFKGRATYGNKFDAGPEVLLSGSYFSTNGERNLYFPEFDDPATNNGHARNRDGDRSRNALAKMTYGDWSFTLLYGKRDKDVPTASWGTIFNDPDERTQDRHLAASLEYQGLLENQWEVLARLTYQNYYYLGDYPYDYPPRTLNRDESRGTWWGTEIRMTKKLFEKHRVTGGVEFRDNFQQDMQNVDLDPYAVYLDNERSSNIWAAYLQDEVSLARNLLLNLGVRYDYYSTFGGTLNPRFALIYKPFEETILKALYGSAFRAPNAYELYYVAAEASKANPNLEPETINSYELVVEQYWGKHLSGSVSLFYYNIKDLIAQREDPIDGLLMFDNVESIQTRGVEIEVNGKWKNGFQGRLSYAYQEAEDGETGQVPPNSPKHLAKATLIVPIIEEKVFLGLEEQFVGTRKTLQGGTADSFFTTNVTLYSKNLLKGLEASFSVYNLLDEQYDHPGSWEHIQDLLRQDGRIFNVKLTYRF